MPLEAIMIPSDIMRSHSELQRFCELMRPGIQGKLMNKIGVQLMMTHL